MIWLSGFSFGSPRGEKVLDSRFGLEFGSHLPCRLRAQYKSRRHESTVTYSGWLYSLVGGRVDQYASRVGGWDDDTFDDDTFDDDIG